MNKEELRQRKIREKKAMLRVTQKRVGVAFFIIVAVSYTHLRAHET